MAPAWTNGTNAGDMPFRGGLATCQPCFCVCPRSPARPRLGWPLVPAVPVDRHDAEFRESTDLPTWKRLQALKHLKIKVEVPEQWGTAWAYLYIKRSNQYKMFIYVCCCCCIALVVSDSVRPHRQQPTRLLRPWDFPGESTGVGCHCLLHHICTEVHKKGDWKNANH